MSGVFFILLLGFLLRVVNLGQSLWLDEAAQAITSAGSLSGIFLRLKGDFHPPLYHIFLWGWEHIFGKGEAVIRAPSVIFGTMTVFVVYRIAQKMAGKKEFKKPLRSELKSKNFLLMAALLISLAPLHVYYSQEARPYALSALLTASSMYFFIRLAELGGSLSAHGRRLLAAGYITLTILALYSSYYFLFVILAQAIVIFLTKNFFLYRYLLISLLLFLPWLPFLLWQIQTGREAMILLPEWGRIVSLSFWKSFPLTFIKFAIGRITFFNKTVYFLVSIVLGIIYGVVFIRGFLGKKRLAPPTPFLTVVLWFFVPLVCAWLISFFVPNYQPFRLLPVLPAFYLLLFFGLMKFSLRPRVVLSAIIAVVSLFSVLVYHLNPFFHREDWRGVVGFIEGTENSIAILPSETSLWPWEYYSEGKAKLVTIAKGISSIHHEETVAASAGLLSSTIPEELSSSQKDNQIVGSRSLKKVFFIRYLVPLFDPEEKIDLWLRDNGFVKIKEVSFNQIPVWEYEKAGEIDWRPAK